MQTSEGIPLTATGTGQTLYARAKRLIPGGTQLLTKRPEMFLPDLWPAYYAKALGAEVWDLDGNRYLDMSYNGIGACVLGHADPDVNAAVKEAVDSGTMSTLNSPEEVDLAELCCSLHPWADMVRYTRSGGEAMAVAVRIARAHTGRDAIAVCGYHGWHDWYLSTNLRSSDALNDHMLTGLEPDGVPRGLTGSVDAFHYNCIDEIESIVSRRGKYLAAIVMEPMRAHPPETGFLERIRELVDSVGAVLVFDEITVGFRLNPGGTHLLHDIRPDVAVFAKAVGNGYPLGIVMGTEKVMQSAQSSFISSTSWTERIGSAAGLATIGKFVETQAQEKLISAGNRVQEVWRESAALTGLDIRVSGIAPLSHFSFPGTDAVALKTLYTHRMLERGYLATTAFYATASHTSEHLDRFEADVREVFAGLAAIQDAGDAESHLETSAAHTGFQRLT